MHDNVLVLPEGGPNFLRTVKLTALYADRVHVYCPTNEEYLNSLGRVTRRLHPTPERLVPVIESAVARDPQVAAQMGESPTIRQELSEAIEMIHEAMPLTQYLRVCAANRADLEVLRREGVVTSIVDNAFPYLPKEGDPWPDFFAALRDAVYSTSKSQINKLKERGKYFRDFTARSDSASAYFDTILAVIGFTSPHMKKHEPALEKLQNEGTRQSIAGGLFFLISSFYASQNGCVGVTWDDKVQECFEKFCDVLFAGQQGNNLFILRREQMRARIGRQVLEDQVPDVSQLPIEVILDIRQKRQGELKYFRDSLSKLAAQVDPELRGRELTAAVDSAIQTEIRPALNELNASLANLETERNRRLLTPEKDVVAFAVSSLLGVQVGMPLQFGAMGVLASKLIDYTYGHKAAKVQAVRSNPWSILFHLNGRRRR